MWECVGAIVGGLPSPADDYTRNFERMLDGRPGAIIHVNRPGDAQFFKRLEKAATECSGCGAPLKAYIHHCEYCRREK